MDAASLPPSLVGLPKEALHRGATELPFVDLGDGSHLQVLHIDLVQGLWVVRVRFDPGCTIAEHRHTGSVFAVTHEGSWHYLEYPDQKNAAGSYLFEPAGSTHTLHVPKHQSGQTLVWFAVFGANLILDGAGKVVEVVDAAAVLKGYRLACAASDRSAEGVIVVGEDL